MKTWSLQAKPGDVTGLHLKIFLPLRILNSNYVLIAGDDITITQLELVTAMSPVLIADGTIKSSKLI